ncbi:MAG: hypothetical protein GX998_00460 [Firmicutes bacterium]|nr:hypothetical protein [Bacillota bacterium]
MIIADSAVPHLTKAGGTLQPVGFKDTAGTLGTDPFEAELERIMQLLRAEATPGNGIHDEGEACSSEEATITREKEAVAKRYGDHPTDLAAYLQQLHNLGLGGWLTGLPLNDAGDPAHSRVNSMESDLSTATRVLTALETLYGERESWEAMRQVLLQQATPMPWDGIEAVASVESGTDVALNELSSPNGILAALGLEKPLQAEMGSILSPDSGFPSMVGSQVAAVQGERGFMSTPSFRSLGDLKGLFRDGTRWPLLAESYRGLMVGTGDHLNSRARLTSGRSLFSIKANPAMEAALQMNLDGMGASAAFGGETILPDGMSDRNPASTGDALDPGDILIQGIQPEAANPAAGELGVLARVVGLGDKHPTNAGSKSETIYPADEAAAGMTYAKTMAHDVTPDLSLLHAAEDGEGSFYGSGDTAARDGLESSAASWSMSGLSPEHVKQLLKATDEEEPLSHPTAGVRAGRDGISAQAEADHPESIRVMEQNVSPRVDFSEISIPAGSTENEDTSHGGSHALEGFGQDVLTSSQWVSDDGLSDVKEPIGSSPQRSETGGTSLDAEKAGQTGVALDTRSAQSAHMADARPRHPIPHGPVSARQVVEQIVDRVQLEMKGDYGEIRLQLKPDHLGDLQVKIATNNGIVSAAFMAESHTVKSLIEAGLPQLKQQLMQQGLNVQDVSVQVGGGSSHGREPYSSGSNHNLPGGWLQAEAADTITGTTRPRQYLWGNTIDCRV